MNANANSYSAVLSISNFLGGFKNFTAPTGTLAASATETLTLNWATPFADANYSVACTVLPNQTGILLAVDSIGSVTAASVTLTIKNLDGSNSWSGTISCRGREPT